MSYAPCKNPNCKSFGRPHPNCKCYDEFAEGGDVSFCSGPHKRDCQYFAEGGAPAAPGAGEVPEPQSGDEVPQDLLPGEEAASPNPGPGGGEIPDEPVPGSEVPEDLLPEAEPQSGDEVPEDLLPEPGAFSLPHSVGDAAQRLAGDGLFRTPAPEEEHAPGERWDTPENVKAMNEKAERAASIGSIVTGGGIVKGATAAAEAIAGAANLSKTGASILKGAIANGLIQSGDEVSKWMMDDASEHPVAAVIAATGLGGLAGLGVSKATDLSKSFIGEADKKLGSRVSSFLAGIATAANVGKDEAKLVRYKLWENLFDKDAHALGEKFFRKTIDNAGKVFPTGAAGAGAYRGWKNDGLEGAVKGGLEGYALSKGASIGTRLLGKAATKAVSRVATPVVLKILSNGTTRGMLEALDHADKVAVGVKKVDDVLAPLFLRGGAGAGNAASTLASDKRRQEIEDYLEGGGVDQDIKDESENSAAPVPAFAEGGEVSPMHGQQENGVALHFPAQNMMMQAAKARAANYLNTLRPAKIHPKLAFDPEPDMREKNRTYQRAVEIAAEPLSVIQKIQKGTIEPEHIRHLSAMYPEVKNLLQERLTQRIVKDQLDGKKPTFKVRQGLSMLLSVPLSSDFLPQNIQAAQAVFAQKQNRQQGEPPAKKKKGTSSLTNSDRSFLTSEQARVERQQRAH